MAYPKTEQIRKPRQRFALELEAGPNCADPVRQLRLLLKVAKRRYGLKCTSAALLVEPKVRP